MIKRIIPLVFVCMQVFVFPADAQFGLSQMMYGGGDYDIVRSVARSGDGGYYILCSSASDASGNHTAENFGEIDYWLIKTDSLFAEEWQVSYGSEEEDSPSKILKDDAGNIYLCGTTTGPASGNRTVDAYGMYSYWVVKLDAEGNGIWQKAYGGDVVESLRDAVLMDNKLYLFGRSSSGVSGTKTGFKRGGTDYWLVCADTAGNVLWDKTYGGEGFDFGRDILADSAGVYLYLGGYSSSGASYEKSEDNTGFLDLWLIKVNAANGELVKEKTLGSDGDNYFRRNSMAMNGGYLYILTDSNAGISGYKTDTSRGGYDYWILKTDLDFKPLWDKTIGGEGAEQASGIIARDNTLILGGYSTSDSGFDKSEDAYVTGSSDAWLVCLDTSGIVLWDKIIGSYSTDHYIMLHDCDSAAVISIGSYDAHPSGDLDLNGFGDYDAWILRLLLPWSDVESISNTLSVELYPNPVSDKLMLSTPVNTETLYSVYSLTGQLLQSGQSEGGNTALDVRPLAKGMYLLEVSQGDATGRKCFVVN